jgi:hypothetical protein
MQRPFSPRHGRVNAALILPLRGAGPCSIASISANQNRGQIRELASGKHFGAVGVAVTTGGAGALSSADGAW